MIPIGSPLSLLLWSGDVRGCTRALIAGAVWRLGGIQCVSGREGEPGMRHGNLGSAEQHAPQQRFVINYSFVHEYVAFIDNPVAPKVRIPTRAPCLDSYPTIVPPMERGRLARRHLPCLADQPEAVKPGSFHERRLARAPENHSGSGRADEPRKSGFITHTRCIRPKRHQKQLALPYLWVNERIEGLREPW